MVKTIGNQISCHQTRCKIKIHLIQLHVLDEIYLQEEAIRVYHGPEFALLVCCHGFHSHLLTVIDIREKVKVLSDKNHFQYQIFVIHYNTKLHYIVV